MDRRTAFENKLDHISTGSDKSGKTLRPLITESYRHLSSVISEGIIYITEASKLFNIGDLELATWTFFHDLEYSGTGHHHRVNRKNLPRLSNPMISLLVYLVSL